MNIEGMIRASLVDASDFDRCPDKNEILKLFREAEEAFDRDDGIAFRLKADEARDRFDKWKATDPATKMEGSETA